jgi:membrane dipeptidase
MSRSLRFLTVVFLALLCFACQPSDAQLPSDPLERARALLRQVPLIDGHNDLPWQYRQKASQDVWAMDIAQPQPELHTDIARLREGMVGAQFWSVYVPASMQGKEAVRATMEEIDIVYQLARRYPDTFQLALTADEVEAAFKAGKIASMMGMEGGHSIDSSMGALRMMYQLGARYMTLTHSRNVPWADSATDSEKVGGLTPFGNEVVREMNRLGMLVDLSHVAPSAMHDALDVSEAPIIFSHSSARAVCDHARNAPDDVLKRLPQNGGVIMVTFVPDFISEQVRLHSARHNAERTRLRALPGSSDASVESGMKSWDQANPAPRATLAQVADHIDHIRKTAGVDHIGLGGDYDGIETVPQGLEDVSKYPALIAELIRRGYSDEDILKITGGNILRVMRQAEQVAARLQKERNPSGARIETLDKGTD